LWSHTKKRKKEKLLAFFSPLKKGKKSLTHLNQFREKEKKPKRPCFFDFRLSFFWWVLHCFLLFIEQKTKKTNQKETHELPG